jgi:hypothetical protein
MGYLISQRNIEFQKHKKTILLLSSLVYIATLQYWNFKICEFQPLYLDNSICLYSILKNILRIVIGISGSVVLIITLSFYDKTNSIISNIGMNTLSFYVLNSLFSETQRSLMPLNIDNEWYALSVAVLLSAIQIPIYLKLTNFFLKNKYTALFLLGRQQ